MAIVDLSAKKQNKPDRELLSLLLQESAKRHSHLCPRQVLGVRLGLCALRTLELVGFDYQPRFLNLDKRLLTIVETDGCGADGVSIATTCSVGRRTLRVLDYGKLAATLVDTRNNRAVRVVPSSLARERAVSRNPGSSSRWQAYLRSYQVMPDDELVVQQEVHLTKTLSEILSKPSKRALCDICSEEIMNEREVYTDSQVLCKGCAGESYYVPKR